MIGGPLILRGLDAQNPLGFMAALGLLRVLDDHARRQGSPRPRLGFGDVGISAAVIQTHLTVDDIFDVVLADAADEARDPLLVLAYDESGNEVNPSSKKALRDLKPSPALARTVLGRAARHTRRSSDRATAAFSETVQANKGDTKPTALHFTAGQSQFLKIVDDVRSQLTETSLREALLGPWTYSSALSSLRWDAGSELMYALRAAAPSDSPRGSVPAANWLASIGLCFFPVVPAQGRLGTTGVSGGRRDSRLIWPVWQPLTGIGSVESLLRLNCGRLTEKQRRALGVTAVYSARIVRADQGGRGVFAPSEPVVSA